MVEESINNKEIDLLSAFSNFFKSIGNGVLMFIIFFYKTIKRYKYIYISTIIIATILVVKNKNSNNKTITAFYDSQYNEVITSLTKKLDKNIQNKNYILLSKSLNLSQQDVKGIKSIKIEKESYETRKKNEIVQEKVIEIDQAPIDLYCFKIVVSDGFEYNKAQEGLDYFFNNNKFLKEKREGISTKYQILKSSIIGQINQLEIYQKKLIEKPEIKTVEFVDNKMVLTNDNLFNNKMIQLSSRLGGIDDTLKTNQTSIRFISDFSEDKQSSTLSLLLYFVFAIGISFVISTMIELIKWLEKQSKINKAESVEAV